MTPQTWTAIGEVVGAAVIVGGVVLAALRASLGKSFVTHAEHREMGERVGGIEKTLGHRLGAAEARVGALETSHAGLAATLTETKDSVKRVEHQTTLLVTHLLNRDQRNEA